MAPEYLCDKLPPNVSVRQAHLNKFRPFYSSTDYYRNSFFPYCVDEWNRLSPEIRCIDRISIFKKTLLPFFRPMEKSVYNVHDVYGLKLLVRLRVEFSHLKEHKFSHNFSDTPLPLCDCGILESESTEHFLLRCQKYITHRKCLLDKVESFISGLNSIQIVDLLLYGGNGLDDQTNESIISSTILFLKSTKRFDLPLFATQPIE